MKYSYRGRHRGTFTMKADWFYFRTHEALRRNYENQLRMLWGIRGKHRRLGAISAYDTHSDLRQHENRATMGYDPNNKAGLTDGA